MRLVDPPRPVLVQRGDRWCNGELRAWRRDAHGWRGYVRYSVSPGMRHLDWIPAEHMRPE
jgi:hypothetical protein